MNNLDHTFTTPVFNGSASLRNAAGELVENVVKSTKRKQTVDDAYIENLYDEVSALYHLDQLSQASGSERTWVRCLLLRSGCWGSWVRPGCALQRTG